MNCNITIYENRKNINSILNANAMLDIFLNSLKKYLNDSDNK